MYNYLQIYRSRTGMQNYISKIDDKIKLDQNRQTSFAHSMGNSRSNTKFIIRYDQRQISANRSNSKTNRYSAKYQFNQIRHKKITHSVLDKNGLVTNGTHVPSYLRPTQASISAQLQRNRIASLADINSNEIKSRSIAKLRSKSLEEEENQQEKQYNRIPIQFYDQKNHGCGADSLRARVVYRGYAPKNTYYYLKTLKPFKRKPKRSMQNPQSSQQIQTQKSQIGMTPLIPTANSVPSLNLLKNDLDIRFESKFQSGNLSAAARISIHQYWLYMRQDTNTHGLRQWYYFSATNKKPIKIKFRIYKFTKSYSLYRMGMKPYIRTSINDNIKQWQQGGQKIKYEFDNTQRCFYLQFEYKFQQDNQEVQFAMLPPYTYSMLKQYLRGLQSINEQQNQDLLLTGVVSKQIKLIEQQQKSIYESYNQIKYLKQTQIKIQVINIGQTLAGLDIAMIQIKKNSNKNQFIAKSREAIVVLARTHPGETVSNFSLESFIDTVVQSRDIIEFYDFFILPMVNPDGVYFGNHRTSIIGQDLNRNFHNNDFQIFPQIQAVHTVINRARRTHKIKFLIDLHGHSARKNIFAYGDEHQIGSSQYLHSRILPKLLNDNISSFKYDYCIFKQSKQKKNTARVFYTNKFKINCVTIEQSYGILDEGPIGIRVWKNFGVALANSILQYAQMYKQGKQRALQQYLSEQIQKQKQQRERILQKHRQMFAKISQTIQNKNKQQQINIKDKQYKVQKLEVEQTQKIQQNKQQEIDGQDKKVCQQQNEDQEQKSINMSQLSSGDQDLQLKFQEIQTVKKDIFKIGCLKQGLKRQIYNVADKKLELFETGEYSTQKQQTTTRRLHQQKSSMIPRIAKLQQKRKDDYNLSFKREFRQNHRDLFQKQRQIRRREIQIRFKRMQLPSIKK